MTVDWKLIQQMNTQFNQADPFADAITGIDKSSSNIVEGNCGGQHGSCGAGYENEEASNNPCAKYFDPSRLQDFAVAIGEMMNEGMSYGDAKANVFDETNMPPAESPCCNALYEAVSRLSS